jgi:hypothetical protein
MKTRAPAPVEEASEISLLVSVLVEPVESGGTITPRQVRTAARQAIRNALWDREDSGFDHDLDDKVTVSLAGITLVKPKKGAHESEKRDNCVPA